MSAPILGPMSEPSADLERLIEVMAALEVAPADLQVLDPARPGFDAGRPLLVLPPLTEAMRALLADRYPSTHPVRVALEAGVVTSTAGELPSEARGWLMLPLAPEDDVRSVAGLRAVMERLYGPDGCPWDREQTHESLRRYLLEECYEVVDAIDRGDLGGLREELGDLLAHVFMHTAMAQERREFALEDVTESAARKMVRRHPHVFGDEAAGSNEELLARWDEIKAAERVASAEAPPSVLASVPRAAPSLQRAQSLQQRATRAGIEEPALPSMQALARAVGQLAAMPGPPALGGLLWAAVRVARELDVDAEEALRERASAFTSAVGNLESRARAESAELSALPLEARRAPWRNDVT
ncbi:MAG: MazG family protein [Dehalococcoidia bacterium]